MNEQVLFAQSQETKVVQGFNFSCWLLDTLYHELTKAKVSGWFSRSKLIVNRTSY